MSFPTEYNAQVATQAAGQATLFAACLSSFAAQRVTDASANCTKSLNARIAIHAAFVANGNTGPNPGVPGCTP